jgi:predicted ATPase
MKTILYVSQSTPLLLKQSNVTLWFPETQKHPVELCASFDEILGQVVATHSETLVNLIGHKIAQGKVNSKDFEVRIVLSEFREKICRYDNEGYLQNWTLGFFDLPF